MNNGQAAGQGTMEVTAESYAREQKLKEMKENQNIVLGTVAGIAAAIIGATVWAVITVLTDYQIGWMAIGVGAFVGFAIRYLGKGIDPHFATIGAVISFIGCVIGNFLTVVIVVSRQEGVAITQLLSNTTPAIFFDIMKETFNPMDVLFYGLAIYAGYKYSRIEVE